MLQYFYIIGGRGTALEKSNLLYLYILLVYFYIFVFYLLLCLYIFYCLAKMWTSVFSVLHAAEPLGLIVAVVPVSIPTVDPFVENEDRFIISIPEEVNKEAYSFGSGWSSGPL